MKSGGGWKAIQYTLRMANRVGWWKLWRAMRSKNTCKTCALGMGGQLGGMVNEGGYFPEVCKKSFQAMASDMQAGITPEFFARYGFNELRAMTPRQLESSGRLVPRFMPGPMIRTIASFRGTRRSSAGRGQKGAGARFSMPAAAVRTKRFLLQLLARVRHDYVNNCHYCHQAFGVGWRRASGRTGTIRLEDLEHADLYILIGGNPASNHPRLMRSLMLLRRHGGQVVVVNPTRELGLVNFRVPSDVRSLLFGTQIASLYLQPHIGGDIALLTGLAKEVLTRGGHDTTFIAQATEGFAEFERHVDAVSWDEIERCSVTTRFAASPICTCRPKRRLRLTMGSRIIPLA